MWLEHYKNHLAPLISAVKAETNEQTCSFLKFQLRLRLAAAEKKFTALFAAATTAEDKAELLVVLGDLCRYDVLASAAKESTHSYRNAMHKYINAIYTQPSNKKAFNQLAVIFMAQKRPFTTATLLLKSFVLTNPCLEDVQKLLHRLASNASRIDDVCDKANHKIAISNLCMNLALRLANSSQDALRVHFEVPTSPSPPSGAALDLGLDYLALATITLSLTRQLPAPRRQGAVGQDNWILEALESLLHLGLQTQNSLLVYLSVQELLNPAHGGLMRKNAVLRKINDAKFGGLDMTVCADESLPSDFLTGELKASRIPEPGLPDDRDIDKIARNRLGALLKSSSATPAVVAPVVSVRSEKETQMVVIDGLNVAIAHGQHERFSVIGLILAKNFFEDRGFQVVICLPRPYTKKGGKPGSPEAKTKTPMQVMEFFEGEQHKILLTPPQDYDDGYILELAKRRNAIIVSNDKFRDFLASEKNKKLFKQWLEERLCSYAFYADEFIPNPAFFK